MKQIIVMVAMIILGIAIAGLIGDFKHSAESISDRANEQIMEIVSSGAFNWNWKCVRVIMKQFIVLCSTVVLGIAIFNMIMGPADDSVINIVKEVWCQGILIRTNTP